MIARSRATLRWRLILSIIENKFSGLAAGAVFEDVTDTKASLNFGLKALCKQDGLSNFCERNILLFMRSFSRTQGGELLTLKTFICSS